VTNQFYMLMDTPTGYPSPAWGTGDLANVTSGTTTASTSTAGVTTITNVSATGVTTSSTKGWRFDFGQCEQSVNKALTIAGVTYFGTNAPGPTTTGSCAANLGIARGYAVDYLTGNASYANRYGVYVGGGMPPSPVAGVVSVGGTKYPFCIGCINPDAANSSALQGTKVVINPKGSRYRAYWYRESD
jgi:type IV pilus assembly protein PilY1